MAGGKVKEKDLRDKLKTETQKQKFDKLIASGVRAQDAYRIALWS